MRERVLAVKGCRDQFALFWLVLGRLALIQALGQIAFFFCLVIDQAGERIVLTQFPRFACGIETDNRDSRDPSASFFQQLGKPSKLAAGFNPVIDQQHTIPGFDQGFVDLERVRLARVVLVTLPSNVGFDVGELAGFSDGDKTLL